MEFSARAQVRRDWSGESVTTEAKGTELGEVSDGVYWDLARESVAGEVEGGDADDVGVAGNTCP